MTYYDELPASNGNAVQYAQDLETLSKTSYTLGVYNGTGIQIHEIQENIAAKFLMVGLSMENNNYTYFNNNTINILKNAAEYLTDKTAKYNYSLTYINGITSETVIYYIDGVIVNPEQTNIEIFDISGNKVASGNSNTIDVNNLQSGLYIAKTKNTAIKFIK